MEQNDVLSVVGLRKRFGPVEVLRGVDLSLGRGEVLAIVGDNGAGKSTLIKNISGVYRLDSGEIYIDGTSVQFESPRHGRALGIETVYQDLALAEDLGVGANIFLGREPVRRFLGILPVIENQKIKVETDRLLGRIESHIPKAARATRRVGINVTAMTVVAYTISAGMAAIAGILLVGRLSVATPTAAMGYELSAIAAVVVGGASLFGGRGTIPGTFVGSVLFVTIGNGANLLGVDPFWEMVVAGLLIALVVYIDNRQKRRQSGLR